MPKRIYRNYGIPLATLLLLLISLSGVAQLHHVYGIQRLRLIKDSVTFIGKVTKVSYEKDGDLHFNLKINDSTTVICECICQNRSPIKKVKLACKGYYKKFKRPRVGSTYRVKGYYVVDKLHKWYELHPVYKISQVLMHKGF